MADLADLAVLTYLQTGRIDSVGHPWPHLAAIGCIMAERRAPAPAPPETWVALSQEARYYLLSAVLSARLQCGGPHALGH